MTALAEEAGWSIVTAAQAGDESAFAEIYARHARRIFQFVLSRTHDYGLAEDLTSETFARALRGIRSVSYEGKDVAAWLFTIARNLIADHRKSSRFRREVVVEVDDDVAVPGPEHQVIADFVREELSLCLQGLSAEQRRCVSLRFLAELSVHETAVVMRKRDSAVRALQCRAVRRMAQLLPEELR